MLFVCCLQASLSGLAVDLFWHDPAAFGMPMVAATLRGWLGFILACVEDGEGHEPERFKVGGEAFTAGSKPCPRAWGCARC